MDQTSQYGESAPTGWKAWIKYNCSSYLELDIKSYIKRRSKSNSKTTDLSARIDHSSRLSTTLRVAGLKRTSTHQSQQPKWCLTCTAVICWSVWPAMCKDMVNLHKQRKRKKEKKTTNKRNRDLHAKWCTNLPENVLDIILFNYIKPGWCSLNKFVAKKIHPGIVDKTDLKQIKYIKLLILAESLNCVILDKLFNLPEPQFPSHEKRNNNTILSMKIK